MMMISYGLKLSLDHFRVFVMHGCIHIDKGIENEDRTYQHQVHVRGIRRERQEIPCIGLETSKIKVSRSVKIVEREVNSIHETQPTKIYKIIHETKNAGD